MEESELYVPPIGEPVVELHKNAIEFWPCLTPHQHEWVTDYENNMLPFVLALGDLLGVIPIKDLQYQAIPNIDKQSNLYLVQTRAGITKITDGIEWYSVVVVVKYCVVMALKCRINTKQHQILPVECVLWDNKARQYTCVTDSRGYIANVAGLLGVIEKWAVAEKLAAWIPQEGPKPVETIHLEKGA
ncbi:MAG: hypothetical protein WC505_05765 [Patescibacteria group bacterium]